MCVYIYIYIYILVGPRGCSEEAKRVGCSRMQDNDRRAAMKYDTSTANMHDKNPHNLHNQES